MNTTARQGIVNSLKSKAYRDAFVETEIETTIPIQIRAMRKRLGWSQKKLAQECGMTQARISVLENPNYEGAVNVKTLVKLASAFDVGLIVRFAPLSEIVNWVASLSEDSHAVPDYQNDNALAAAETGVSIADYVGNDVSAYWVSNGPMVRLSDVMNAPIFSGQVNLISQTFTEAKPTVLTAANTQLRAVA